jgi:hypothetical protein
MFGYNRSIEPQNQMKISVLTRTHFYVVRVFAGRVLLPGLFPVPGLSEGAPKIDQ